MKSAHISTAITRRLLEAEEIAAHDDRETLRSAGERVEESGREEEERGGRNGRIRRPVEKEDKRAEERESAGEEF